LTACATPAQAPATTAQTAKGPVLADAKGMTLYTFDRDAAGTSNCFDCESVGAARGT
jgi:predicted lipoprotein with Yx(FWY)xxD motif